MLRQRDMGNLVRARLELVGLSASVFGYCQPFHRDSHSNNASTSAIHMDTSLPFPRRLYSTKLELVLNSICGL
jgi:hypothetical protein